MQRKQPYISLVLLALACATPLALPGVSAAQQVSAEMPALVTIRFNQARVYFDQQLYGAVAKAVEIKPDVMFDVVSYAPTSGNGAADKQWQAVAGRNTRSVVQAMNGMGVPMERIRVTGQSTPGLRYDETRVFVR